MRKGSKVSENTKMKIKKSLKVYFSKHTIWNKGIAMWKGKKPPNLGKKLWAKKKHPMLGKEGLVGKKNPNWQGGKTTKNGYLRVRNFSHPYCSQVGYVLKSYLVMEKYLGRYIKPGEIVHHKNNNKLDNRLKNLKLFKSISEHMKFHGANKKHYQRNNLTFKP